MKGSQLEMDSICVVVIGGISLAGGRGRVTGVLAGVLVFSICNNMMNLMDVSSNYQTIIKGTLFLAAASLNKTQKGF